MDTIIRRYLITMPFILILILMVVVYHSVDLEIQLTPTPDDVANKGAADSKENRSSDVQQPSGTNAPTPIRVGMRALTNTPINTPTDTPIPTDTLTPTHTPTPTPANTPTPTRTPTPTPRPPSIEVLADELNVCQGPGLHFPVLYVVHKGDVLIVRSKNLEFDSSPWFLLMVRPDGSEEWVTGDTKYVKRYNVANLSHRRTPATPTPVPPTRTPTPVALASNVHDFSGSQGANGWKYLVEEGRNSGRWREMRFGQYGGKNCWLAEEVHVRICADGEVHPGATTRIAYEWRTNMDRNVRIQVHAHKKDTKCGDGVLIRAFRAIDGQGMVEKLGEFRVRHSNNQGVTENYNAHVAPGTLIYVIVDIHGNPECDATQLNVDIY